MDRGDALVILREMVTEYATTMAWHPDDIETYKEDAYAALEHFGVSREEVARGR